MRERLAVALLITTAVAAAASRLTVAQQRGGTEVFREMATVLGHPRCMNCHTREDFPRQGEQGQRLPIERLTGMAPPT